MRKWHRWLSVTFGVFLLWISVTGVLSQVGSLVNNGGFEKETQAVGKREMAAAGAALVAPALAHEEDEAKPAAKTVPAPTAAPVDSAAAAPFVCPADMTCRPKQPPRAWNLGLLHHLHSGESFGPAGVVISLMSGLAMVFFSFSGLWLYISMWRNRKDRAIKPGWFWQ